MLGRAFRIRANAKAVSPVVSEMMLVIMVAGMAASLYITTVGLVPSGPLQTPTFLLLKEVSSNHATAPGYTHLNDSFFQVTAASGAPVRWDGAALSFQLWDQAGGRLMVQGDLLPKPDGQEYLGVYHGSPAEPSVVAVWYVDLGGDNVLGVGDTLQVRGASQEYHGGHFKLIGAGQALATTSLT